MRSTNYMVEMKFSGHTKVVEFSFFEYINAVDCRCRMTWSDNFIEFWMQQKAGSWRFKDRATLPGGIADEETSFHRTITILLKKDKK